jgi:hypothetical protein
MPLAALATASKTHTHAMLRATQASAHWRIQPVLRTPAAMPLMLM